MKDEFGNTGDEIELEMIKYFIMKNNPDMEFSEVERLAIEEFKESKN